MGYFFSQCKFFFRFSYTALSWLFIINRILSSLLNRVSIDFDSISICWVLAWLDSISVNANNGMYVGAASLTQKNNLRNAQWSIHNEFLRFCRSLGPVMRVQKTGFLKFDVMNRAVIHTQCFRKIKCFKKRKCFRKRKIPLCQTTHRLRCAFWGRKTNNMVQVQQRVPCPQLQRRLQHLPSQELLGQQDLFSLEKWRLWGDLTESPPVLMGKLTRKWNWA